MSVKNTRSPRRLRIAALAAVFAASATQPALAETMGVDATVTANCTLSTTPVNFGNAVNVLSSANVDVTGSISVTCTNGTAWAAAADIGTGTGATFDSRKMKNGTDLLAYTLYTDSARTTVWGDAATTATSKISDTGSGSAQTKTIYARIPSGQTAVKAGAYADTVTVTVTY